MSDPTLSAVRDLAARIRTGSVDGSLDRATEIEIACELEALADRFRDRDEGIEWATQLPNGIACEWPDEAAARQAHEVSKGFPGGEHPLLWRYVNPWVRAQTKPCDSEMCPPEDLRDQCPDCPLAAASGPRCPVTLKPCDCTGGGGCCSLHHTDGRKCCDTCPGPVPLAEGRNHPLNCLCGCRSAGASRRAQVTKR